MPSDNDMRLIDANNMKRHLESILAEYKSADDIDSKANATLTQFAIDLIENAPTVNDCPNCEYKLEADYIRSSASYKELTELRKFKEEHERVGNWITENIEKPYGKCDQCGEICEVANYCGNCGAYMRKGSTTV